MLHHTEWLQHKSNSTFQLICSIKANRFCSDDQEIIFLCLPQEADTKTMPNSNILIK